MTQHLPHGSQTSLGETCAFYLDYITASLPSSLHTLHHKFISPLISHPALDKNKSPLLRALSSRQLPDWSSLSCDDYITDLPAVFTLLACAIALVVMSWRNLWRRPSPAYHTTNTSERPSGYTYLTPDDIVDPPSRSYNNTTYTRREEDDSEPDKLLLNHRKVTYELYFPPFSINDGTLSVGQLRQSAAEVTHTADPNRIRLLYKGRLLEDDNLPCRAEGLKQQSEILCVVSEVQGGARTPSDLSEADRTSSEAPRRSTADVPEIVPKSESSKKNKKNKRGKKKKKSAAAAADNSDSDDNDSTPPPQPPRPTTTTTINTASTSPSTLPPQAPNLKSFPTGLDQVNGLLAYFRRELLPLAERYIANPPADEKTREFEHKKLGEYLLAQVILKADGIEPSTDEIRTARRALIKEAQGTLNRVDAVAN
ncbi:uncharacterized protein BDV14DRAFT_59983 [Aspergillus stella-maris]|uniref:uncharacterized protein n=1 Tax=Aspergillus stella-maris TaxID=1810926 RepID=UPI003CCD85BC